MADKERAELYICGQCFNVFSYERVGNKIIRENQDRVWNFRSPDYSLRFENICPDCRTERIKEKARRFAEQVSAGINLL